MELEELKKMIKDTLSKEMGLEEETTPGVELTTPVAQSAPTTTPIDLNQQPKTRKATVVTFDSKTDAPWKVKFTERGFSIDGVRLSFEILETALSKGFEIVLNQGKGLHLDAIKMQKIMKYKDLY